MAKLTAARVVLVPRGKLKKASFPLGYGVTAGQAWENGMACIDTANLGAVWAASVSTTLKPIGKFIESKDNSAGGATIPIGVELTRERDLEYWDSVTGAGSITIANLFQTLYIASDHELTTSSSGASIYGVMWTFSPQGYPNGVGVEPLF
jgi:hypothetical protein